MPRVRSRLTLKQREAIELFLDGHSADEVAGTLRISSRRVKRWLKRSRFRVTWAQTAASIGDNSVGRSARGLLVPRAPSKWTRALIQEKGEFRDVIALEDDEEEGPSDG